MSRPLRIEFEGAIYHVTGRGNARAPIVLDDADRGEFLSLYGGVAGRLGWRCYAYCLMGNHYHWVIETPRADLGRGMRQLNGVYTQRFNRRHGRVGHLFQGRYKAILVEREPYLKALCRYVVLNPVRAGLVARVGDWRWSSYRASAGLEPGPGWLDADWLLAQFARDRDAACVAYRRFVAEGRRAPPVWQGLRGQIYLGSEAFAERLTRGLREPPSLSEVPLAQRRPSPLSLAAYQARSGDDDQAMAAAYRSGGYTMQEIARHFAVHYSTVSRAIRRCEADQAISEPPMRDCKT